MRKVIRTCAVGFCNEAEAVQVVNRVAAGGFRQYLRKAKCGVYQVGGGYAINCLGSAVAVATIAISCGRDSIADAGEAKCRNCTFLRFVCGKGRFCAGRTCRKLAEPGRKRARI